METYMKEYFMFLRTLCSLSLVVCASSLSAQSSAEAIRKALDQPLKVDFSGNNLNEVLQHLKKKTGLPIAIDQIAMMQIGMVSDFDNINIPGLPNQPGHGPIELKSDGKARQALHRLLAPYHLTYAIVDDTLYVTTEEVGIQRQMQQHVPVDVKNAPLHDALRDLTKATGVNLILDPRLGKAGQTPVTLQLADASLETSVRLLAELGGLRSVRIGNVLFVTTEERAEKISRETLANQLPVRMPQTPKFQFGGMNMAGAVGGAFAIPALPPVAQPEAQPEEKQP